MIVTRALQVNPRNPAKPLEIKAQAANRAHAAMLMFRTRRSTVAASSCSGFRGRSVVISQPGPEEIEERRGDPEAEKNPGQPRARAEELVQPPSDERAGSDGDGKQPSDRRRLEKLMRLPSLFVIERHCESPCSDHAPALPS